MSPRRPRPRTDTFWVIASPRVALCSTAASTRREAWRKFDAFSWVSRRGYRAVRVTVELPEAKS